MTSKNKNIHDLVNLDQDITEFLQDLDTRTTRLGADSLYIDPRQSKAGKFNVCSNALHPEFSYPLADVAEMSIEKGYEPLNWARKDTRVTASYLINATQRHFDRLKMGIDINDTEVKQDGSKCRPVLHAAQAAYNLLMFCRMQADEVLIDDRLFKDGELK